MADQPHDLLEVYGQYVRLRKTGVSRNNAVVALQPMAGRIGPDKLDKLGKLIQVWEARQSDFYKSDLQPQNPPAAPLGSVTPSSAFTNPEQDVPCHACQHPNKIGEMNCYACGAVLQPVIPPHMNTAYFGHNSVLCLTVRGIDKPLEGHINHEAIIGRSALDNPMCPDIDLARFNAEAWGVSRLHATLKAKHNTLSIQDMNSTNHTFINGKRLHAHEVRVLHDGDEIRLGKLTIMITFRHQSRPLD